MPVLCWVLQHRCSAFDCAHILSKEALRSVGHGVGLVKYPSGFLQWRSAGSAFLRYVARPVASVLKPAATYDVKAWATTSEAGGGRVHFGRQGNKKSEERCETDNIRR